MPRDELLDECLREHQAYLEATRRNGPSFSGALGKRRHERHEAKMALLVSLLESAKAASDG